MTRLSEFDYELPEELIAQEPLEERDQSRLLRLLPDGSVAHRRFVELPEMLSPGDLLVLNDTRVFPARLIGRRGDGEGGVTEILLLEDLGESRWRALARPARKLRVGTRLLFGARVSGSQEKLEGRVEEVEPEGKRVVRFAFEGEWDDLINELGVTPLPPYIESATDERSRRERYQTVYARPKGSVAAPTAGLHFTDPLFRALERRGVRTAFLTLHVGYATFEPIHTEEIDQHRMGLERFVVPEKTKAAIEKTKGEGGRVVAVGTTTVRALESAALAGFPPGFQTTELFIAPGFRFRCVDGLLTNFHLPRSSLLILVSALGGRERVLAAYREAVRHRYRFYSFGDAMLL